MKEPDQNQRHSKANSQATQFAKFRLLCRPVAAVPAAAIAGIVLAGCEPDPVQVGTFDYSAESLPAGTCKEASRSGKPGISDDEVSANGLNFSVRTPANYDATIAHPMFMVYAPAGRSRFGTERMTGLTLAATSAGYIISYADHERISPSTLPRMAEIPKQVAANWCVDDQRIYLTGHSDGGTAAMGLAFLEETRHLPGGIAPSATGIRGSDLVEYSCPDPLSVLVMHSREDSLFPGYGKETVEWWAACNQCSAEAKASGQTGCQTYSDCAPGTRTWYCEGNGAHGKWPEINSTILDFFANSETPGSKTAQPTPTASE
jgi:polyhydroxybutyrate depolymerase